MTDVPISSPAQVKQTWMPTTAGVLCIIAGALELINGLFIGTIFGILSTIFAVFTDLMALPGIGVIVGIPMVIFGIVSMIGGIYCLRRKNWGLCLAGAICALLPGSGLLGILSIIFISISKKEFD